MVCANLKTGETRNLTKKWSATGIHCICTGFGYVAYVTGHDIFIAEERNWNNFWTRQYVCNNHMPNSCVITKLLGENGEPDEAVLIVGSNGGAVYTLTLPKALPDEYLLIDRPTEEEAEHDTGIFSHLGVGIDQTGVPEGKIRVAKARPAGTIEIKQCLLHVSRSEDDPSKRAPLRNINCLAQGKGTYTDYLVGAPDYESRIYIFIRSYDKLEDPHQVYRYRDENVEDCRQVIFELVEQQQNHHSIIMPIGIKPEPKTDEEKKALGNEYSDYQLRYGHSDFTPNSLNLAWAPWYHRSIIAAGTDSGRLFIYDFDAVQRLLCEHEPTHIFDWHESRSTVLFQAKLDYSVRLLKFSPVPSVPILAVCETNTFISFIDCRDWHIERIKLPNIGARRNFEIVTCGMTWAPDASAVYVSTNRGIIVYKVKLLPSLSDRVLVQMVNNYDYDPSELLNLDNAEEMQERFNLMSFGMLREKGASVHWMDQDDIHPEPVPAPIVWALEGTDNETISDLDEELDDDDEDEDSSDEE